MQVRVQLIKDDPWLISSRVAKELYAPREVRFTRKEVIPQQVAQQVTAKQARDLGLAIDGKIPDHQQVTISNVEDQEQEIKWTETRLVFKGKQYRSGENIYSRPKHGRRLASREEMAAAAEAPISFIYQYDRLIELIDKETNHWKITDMAAESIKPLVVVILGFNSEEENPIDRVYSRAIFCVKDYRHQNIVVEDSTGTTLQLELTAEAEKESRIHRFILFLPSNTQLIDIDTNEIIL